MELPAVAPLSLLVLWMVNKEEARKAVALHHKVFESQVPLGSPPVHNPHLLGEVERKALLVEVLEELALVVSPVEVYAHRDRRQVSREALEESLEVVLQAELQYPMVQEYPLVL